MSDTSEVRFILEMASLGPEVTKDLQDKLRALGIETSERYFAMLSAEPPRWIELIGTIAAWEAFFGGAARSYLSGVLKAAGEEHWKNRKALTQAALRELAQQYRRFENSSRR